MPTSVERSTEAFIHNIIRQDHRVGLALAAVPNTRIDLHDHEAMAHAVNRIQGQAADMLGLGGVILRQVSPQLVGELVSVIDHGEDVSDSGRYMMLRHGGQRLDEETGDLKGASQKIRLMQLPHNMTDPLTDQSIAEAVGLGLVLACVYQEINPGEVSVRSSANTRAAEVAAIVARLTGGSVVYDQRLNCVDYPKDKTDQEIDDLLGPANKGSLRWDRTTVDRVIGDGTYDRITENVEDLIREGVTAKGWTIDVTHTQQTNAADLVARREPSRLAEMGFSIWRSPVESTLLPNGVFIP